MVSAKEGHTNFQKKKKQNCFNNKCQKGKKVRPTTLECSGSVLWFSHVSKGLVVVLIQIKRKIFDLVKLSKSFQTIC